MDEAEAANAELRAELVDLKAKGKRREAAVRVSAERREETRLKNEGNSLHAACPHLR